MAMKFHLNNLGTNKEQVIENIIQTYRGTLRQMKSVYIFGAKSLGMKTYSGLQQLGIETKAFIDNNPAYYGTMIYDRPVCHLGNVTEPRPIIVVASILYMNEMIDQIKIIRPEAVIIPYPILSIWNQEVFPDHSPLENLFDDLTSHQEQYQNLFKVLADNRSKKVLLNILNFRTTLNFDWLKKSCDTLFPQYLDLDIIEQSADEVFIDGGGYNGDTTESFTNLFAHYKKIYLYEPDLSLLNMARKSLSQRENVVFRNCGLYSENSTIRFSATGSIDGKIDENGDATITVTTLDKDVCEKISFIKLDIEGSELQALMGAREHIVQEKPKLAIAVYHNAEDLWQIPQFIQSLNPTYKFFLRHYTFNVADTVLYCI